MNVIFKVIRDMLHLTDEAEKEKRRQTERTYESGESGEPRRCPVCQAEAGEHDTECPSCGARLD